MLIQEKNFKNYRFLEEIEQFETNTTYILGPVYLVINELVIKHTNNKISFLSHLPILVFIFLIFIFNYYKKNLLASGHLLVEQKYIQTKLVESFIYALLLSLFSNVVFLLIIMFPVLTYRAYTNNKKSFFFVVYNYLLLVIFKFSAYKLNLFDHISNKEIIIEFIINALIVYIFTWFFSIIIIIIIEKFVQIEIEDKNELTKIKKVYSKISIKNENLNEKLSELYTLQEITNTISSIISIDELLKYVNDMILGVIGPSTCSILLVDEKTKKFRVNTTSIFNKKELILFSDNIECEKLYTALNSNKYIIENKINDDDYPFIKDRDITSIAIVQLRTKEDLIGLILLERRDMNFFIEDNIKYLNTIASQVSVSMSNALLYMKQHQLATKDGLTQIYNRMHFNFLLSKHLLNTELNELNTAIIIFDIDNFKSINDRYGHLFGDKVLKKISGIVNECLRKDDVFARFGGEEFIIMLPNTDMENAYKKAEIIRKTIEKTSILEGDIETIITISIGISVYPFCGKNNDELIQKADIALYRAKNEGKNCVRCYCEK